MQGEDLRKGPWCQEEDEQLTSYVTRLGDRRWDSLAKVAGLRRSGKSCRLRWMNYLRPNLKHGPFSVEEEQLIVQLQQQWGNKWSKIAHQLPGRTDNEIKNYWRTHLRKRVQVQQEGVGQKSIDEMVSKDHNNVNLYPQENKFETKDSSMDTFPSPDWELRSSPYEARMLDWISELQNECGGEKELDHDCNSRGTYEYGPQGFAECFDTWDYSGSLWNLN